ncbi:MAG: DUF1573 domain-containing protein [Chlorobi bacterium]|nr:DUF1573 domain-containing protein [Chlorobiota bacterium]
MKKILWIIPALVLTAACSDNPAKKVKEENLQKAKEQMAKMDKFPEMKFDYTEVDFGTRKEGEVLDTVFYFTNVGEAPLVIAKVKTSCGCTVSEWPQEPVMPGERGRIAVSFDTRHKKGNQIKTVTIHSNEKQLTRTLKVKAYIEPAEDQGAASKPAQSVPAGLKLPRIRPDEPGK